MEKMFKFIFAIVSLETGKKHIDFPVLANSYFEAIQELHRENWILTGYDARFSGVELNNV